MRRAVEQRPGQPRGPQIRGQLAEIHVIVAGDEVVGHAILRSMDVSPPGGCALILPRSVGVSDRADQAREALRERISSMIWKAYRTDFIAKLPPMYSAMSSVSAISPSVAARWRTSSTRCS